MVNMYTRGCLTKKYDTKYNVKSVLVQLGDIDLYKIHHKIKSIEIMQHCN
jgi:hypothetical protein